MSTQQSVRHASDFLSTVFILRLNCGLVSMMLVSAVNHKLYESVGKLLGMPTRVEFFRKKESLLARVNVEDSIWNYDS